MTTIERIAMRIKNNEDLRLALVRVARWAAKESSTILGRNNKHILEKIDSEVLTPVASVFVYQNYKRIGSSEWYISVDKMTEMLSLIESGEMINDLIDLPKDTSSDQEEVRDHAKRETGEVFGTMQKLSPLSTAKEAAIKEVKGFDALTEQDVKALASASLYFDLSQFSETFVMGYNEVMKGEEEAKWKKSNTFEESQRYHSYLAGRRVAEAHKKMNQVLRKEEINVKKD